MKFLETWNTARQARLPATMAGLIIDSLDLLIDIDESEWDCSTVREDLMDIFEDPDGETLLACLKRHREDRDGSIHLIVEYVTKVLAVNESEDE